MSVSARNPAAKFAQRRSPSLGGNSHSLSHRAPAFLFANTTSIATQQPTLWLKTVSLAYRRPNRSAHAGINSKRAIFWVFAQRHEAPIRAAYNS
jgi:hypothetical protein